MSKRTVVTDNRVTRFVDKLVQGTLVRRLISHWIGFTVVIAVVFGVVTWMLTWLLHPMANRDELYGKFWLRLGPVIAVAVVLVPIFVYDTIRLTHRMVGPMVRVRRELQNLAEGRRAQRVKFRPDDYWTEVADEFNAFCDVVEPHVCSE